MPLYEFECKKCGHNFDKVLTLSEVEKEPVPCPECGSGDVVKLISSGRVEVGVKKGYRGKVG